MALGISSGDFLRNDENVSGDGTLSLVREGKVLWTTSAYFLESSVEYIQELGAILQYVSGFKVETTEEGYQFGESSS